jgi:hypothetical protein
MLDVTATPGEQQAQDYYAVVASLVASVARTN